MDDIAFLMNVETKEQAKDYKYFFRGIYNNKVRAPADDIVETKKVNRLAKYDQMLK